MGNIHFYDINLIRSDLAKNILSSERLHKICAILSIKPSFIIKTEQLAYEIVEQFVRWEYSSFMDPDEKAKELLFQQIISILENMKSLDELKSLGIFCMTSGKIFQQPVELNCKSSHIVNLETLTAGTDCIDLTCPICKQTITVINMAHTLIDKMYGIVADLIQTCGIREMLSFTACTIHLDSLQSLFNRNDQHPMNLFCFVARNLAEQAIKNDNLYALTRLFEQDHLKKPICNSSKLLYLAAKSHSNQMLYCLIQHGGDINGCDEDIGTPLHYAAFDGRAASIKKLLDHRAKPSALNRDGLTALYIAAQYGNIAAVDALLKVDPLTVDLINPHDGNTPFLAAVKYGQYDAVERLIRSRANVGHINNAGDSALHIAAEYGYEKIIDLLLNNGADINYRNKAYETPLFRAAAYGREGALRLLLKNNIKHIDRKNILGDTALHLAVKFGRMTTVRILLENNANMKIFNTDVESPLHLAIKFNRQDIVRELMQHGADDTCKNSCGETPRMFAEKNFDKNLLTCFREEKMKRETQRFSIIRASL